jgi:hypothetical protein
VLIEVVFKTPDAVDDAVLEAVKRQLGDPAEITDPGDREALEGAVKEESARVKEQIGRFVRFGELVTVEFDTFNGTAKVLPSGTVPPKR